MAGGVRGPEWDADAVRDGLRAHVVDHLADDQALLVVDETGDLKKGTRTVGVQCQCTGTAGRIENSQVVVCLACTSRHGHAAIGRAPYLPKSWTATRNACGRPVSSTGAVSPPNPSWPSG
jgi:SRSO17 transposase